MRDISKNLSVGVSIDPQTISSDTTTNGVGVDVRGYDAAMVEFTSNDVIADGDFALTVEESDALSSGYTAVATAELIGTLVDFSASNEGVQQVGYVGNKRYVRGVVTSTSTSSGGIMGCNVVRGLPHNAPTS
jgi:hypothetical protein